MKDIKHVMVVDGYVVEDFCGGVDKIGKIMESKEVSRGYYSLEICVDEAGREFLIFERGSEEEYIYKLIGEITSPFKYNP